MMCIYEIYLQISIHDIRNKTRRRNQNIGIWKSSLLHYPYFLTVNSLVNLSWSAFFLSPVFWWVYSLRIMSGQHFGYLRMHYFTWAFFKACHLFISCTDLSLSLELQSIALPPSQTPGCFINLYKASQTQDIYVLKLCYFLLLSPLLTMKM